MADREGHMKKGIHYWALPHTLNLREKMEFAKRLGFEGIELVIVEGHRRLMQVRKEFSADDLKTLEIKIRTHVNNFVICA